MADEIWDVYDVNLNKIGKDCIRGKQRLEDGEYHLIVNAIIINKENEVFLARRAENRPNGLKWEFSGGSVKKDETSRVGIKRELEEEIGLVVSDNEGEIYRTIISDKYHDIKHLWLFRKDVDIKNDINFNDGETIDAKFVSIEEYKKMYENNELIHAIDFTVEDFKDIIKLNGTK